LAVGGREKEYINRTGRGPGIRVARRGRAKEIAMSPQRRTEQPPPLGWKQTFALLFWLAVLVVCLEIPFARAVADALGVSYWWGVAVVFVAGMVGLLVILFMVVAVRILYLSRRIRSEEYEFNLVRKIAPTPGAVVRFAEVTAWVAEPDDHPRLLRDALEAARTRFAELLPEFRDRPPVPLRVVCFEGKRELEAYGARLGLPLGALDGVYLHTQPRRIATHAEVVPRRPVEPAELQRSLFAQFFLHQAKGFLIPPWFGLAVCQVVGASGNRGLLGRLNRRARALLTRPGPAGEDWLFRTRGLRLGALLRGWRDFETFTALMRLVTYSRSLGEFLGGELAPADRRERFRAFVTELGRRDDPERVFARHFGHGFDRLLEDWQQAVAALGVGEYAPPPAHVREALLHRVIPLVEDPEADPWERTRAVREMAEAGYLLGADALIHVLEDEGPALRREAAAALEQISGTVAGEDVRHWWEWWHQLPAAAVPVLDAAIRANPRPGPPVAPG
jgi:hypothetical protein